MEMPYGTYFGQSLSAAVNAGQVPKSRLDDMVTRILTSMYSVGVMANFNSTGLLSFLFLFISSFFFFILSIIIDFLQVI